MGFVIHIKYSFIGQQQFHYFHFAACYCHIQRRQTFFVLGIDIGLIGQ